MYKIMNTGNYGWLYITHDASIDDPEPFIELVKAYQKKLNGKVYSVGDFQYKIQNDPLDLILQWDSCFGITIIVPKSAEKATVSGMLNSLCSELNNIINDLEAF